MATLTAGYPDAAHRCFNDEKQIEELFLTVNNLQDWCVALVEELRFVLGHLDTTNVSEAGSVKAENIDTRFAKIKSAQIQSLKADKIKTGTLHVTEEMTIQNNDGSIKFLSDSIVFSDPDGTQRLAMGRVDGSETFVFVLYDKEGNPTLTMNSAGEAVFSGTIQTYKDAQVGNNLTIGGRNEGENKVIFAGTTNSSEIINNDADKIFTFDISYCPQTMTMSQDGIQIDGEQVATEKDIKKLKNQIKELEDKLLGV